MTYNLGWREYIGTHISVTPSLDELITCIGRNGKATLNVLAIVDFDMRFTYASIGQVGSMHDTSASFMHLGMIMTNSHTPSRYV